MGFLGGHHGGARDTGDVPRDMGGLSLFNIMLNLILSPYSIYALSMLYLYTIYTPSMPLREGQEGQSLCSSHSPSMPYICPIHVHTPSMPYPCCIYAVSMLRPH